MWDYNEFENENSDNSVSHSTDNKEREEDISAEEPLFEEPMQSYIGDNSEDANADFKNDNNNIPSQEYQITGTTPDIIECSIPKSEEEIERKKGIRTFIILLVSLIVICMVAAAGYFAGKNSVGNPSNSSLDLQSKPQNTEKFSAEEVYEVANKSVVGIVVYNGEGIQGYASGVVYSEDGYIITNDHIYDDVAGARFKVYAYDGNIYDAAFIAGDTRSDLAVLKVDSEGFFPATFGNSDELNYGEEVVAIGRPNDATSSSSITGGYVSFLNRRVSNSTSYTSRLIQTDSAINPGSSGGALVNMFGQVVGITSSKLVGEGYEGIGYAIPSTTVKYVIQELIKNGSVTTRAKLGITYQEIDPVTASINNSEIIGLQVAEVSQESSVYGKIEVGDIITAVDSQNILKSDVILDKIEILKPGDKITLTVYQAKSGNYKTVEAELLLAESESSYISDQQNNNQISGGGTFDFPYGY